MYFKDRNHAGELLAKGLSEELRERNPVVLALPRGGIPVAFPIAKSLNASLDVLLVRKLGAPGNPEYALGAIAEDGQFWLNREALNHIQPRYVDLDQVTHQALQEMERQEKIFRSGRAPVNVKGRSVILVDDGLATGATMLAAIASVKARGATEIIVAVPVASREGVQILEGEADQIYVAQEPDFFRSVGEWYELFDQVSDQEVVDLLRSSREGSKKVNHEVA